MGKSKSVPLPEYRSPPIDEVACGCQFVNLDRMKLPHFGLFWETIRKEFPTVEHAMPLTNDGAFPQGDASTGLPLPRVWFLDHTETQLIQLQTDRLYYNWRKREVAPEYPRYPAVMKSFAENYVALGKLASDLGLGPLQPTVLDLTYINVFVKGEGWHDLNDLSKLFKDFKWHADATRFLPPPENVLFQAEFPLPDDQGRLSVKLIPGKRLSDESSIYSFQLTARGIGKDTSEAGIREWFDLAREWIVRGFTDLTVAKMQNEVWGRK